MSIYANRSKWPLSLLTELPALHSVLELSSEPSQKTLTIRFDSWTPQNGGGTQPRGYLVETRRNGSNELISGPQIDHDPTVAVYTVLVENLEPQTSYYIRVNPFIEDGGNLYYGNATQEAGPFLTSEGMWLPFNTLRPRQNCRHFVFKCIFLTANEYTEVCS